SGRGADRQKLVAFDLGRDAHGAVLAGLDADDLTKATDINLAGSGTFLRQSEDEFDRVPNVELGLGNKIQAAITDIASIGAEFFAPRFARKNAHRQTHRETPRFAAVSSIRHQDLRAGTNRFDANTRFCKLQS